MATGVNSCISGSKRKIINAIPFCMYCGNIENLVIDHIHPPSRGGDSSLENLTRCCVGCNSMKSCMTIDEFTTFMTNKVVKLRSTLLRYEYILLSLQEGSYKM